MEIRKYQEIMGVQLNEDIAEGRMVVVEANTNPTHDFGSYADLPGVAVPATADEALNARYCLTWPVNNSNAEGAIKLMIPTPSFEWTLRRGGWDQSSNVPFSTEVYLTYPGHQDGVTIPSGWLGLAFAQGVFKVKSGQYAHSADLEVPGAKLEVLNTADDTASEAGKLAYSASGTIAVVEQYDSSDGSLTFRTLGI